MNHNRIVKENFFLIIRTLFVKESCKGISKWRAQCELKQEYKGIKYELQAQHELQQNCEGAPLSYYNNSFCRVLFVNFFMFSY